jgi:hypothetical protein
MPTDTSDVTSTASQTPTIPIDTLSIIASPLIITAAVVALLVSGLQQRLALQISGSRDLGPAPRSPMPVPHRPPVRS